MFLAKKYKTIFSGLTLVLLFLTAAPAVLAETGADKAKGGLNTTASTGYGTGPTDTAVLETLYPATGLPALIGKIVGAGLALLGVIFFVIIIYAGIVWMMAMGKEEKVNEAKDMIVAAILGLVVVLAAYAITRLIGVVFTGPIS